MTDWCWTGFLARTVENVVGQSVLMMNGVSVRLATREAAGGP